MKTFVVAGDLLREALSRRWILGAGLAMTGVLLLAGLSLKLDVVDGALAATRLFGHVIGSDIRSVDVALRPIYGAVAYLVFYGGLWFTILGCADFAPSLLSPGRIEHLLSLPVRRWELLVGTYLGVWTLALGIGLYGAGGLTLLLSIKTGYWTIRPILAALLASIAFAAIYGPMLTASLFSRSASFSSAVGGMLFALGIIASYRSEIARVFNPGLPRTIFETITLLFPRISRLAEASVAMASSSTIDGVALIGTVAGALLFGAGVLALGIWRFEVKDF